MGWLVTGLFPGAVFDFKERIVASQILGLCVWSIVLFIIGHLRLFSGPVFLCCGCGGVGLWLLSLVSPKNRIFPAVPRIKLTKWEIVMIAGILFFVMIAFLAACAPVTGGIRNDEVCYHLYVPHEWLRQHALVPLSFALAYTVGHAELLFALAQSIAPQTGPRLVTWYAFVLSLAAVYLLCRQFTGRSIALTACAILAMNPLIFRTSSISFVDVEVGMFICSGLWMVLCWYQRRQNAWLFYAAVFLGTGCGVKATAYIYSFVICGSVLALFLLQKHRKKKEFRGIALMLCLTAFFAAPWMVRNILLTGSPTYPPPPVWFACEKPLLADSVPFTRQEVMNFADYCAERYGHYERTITNFFRFPWDMTMDPGRFQIGDSIGTLLLSFLPIALFLIWFHGLGWAAILCGCLLGGAGLIYWVALPEARYYIPAFMGLAPVLALVFQTSLWNRPFSALVKTVLIVNLLFSAAIALRLHVPQIRTVFDAQYRHAYISRYTPFSEAFAFCNAVKDRQIVVLYPNQVWFYLTGNYFVDPDALTNPERYAGDFLLDIDYSQTLERDLTGLQGSYAIRMVPADLELVFTGPDARIYRFKKN